MTIYILQMYPCWIHLCLCDGYISFMDTNIHIFSFWHIKNILSKAMDVSFFKRFNYFWKHHNCIIFHKIAKFNSHLNKKSIFFLIYDNLVSWLQTVTSVISFVLKNECIVMGSLSNFQWHIPNFNNPNIKIPTPSMTNKPVLPQGSLRVTTLWQHAPVAVQTHMTQWLSIDDVYTVSHWYEQTLHKKYIPSNQPIADQ